MWTWILFGITVIISLIADGYVRSTYNKMKKAKTNLDISGQEVADKIIKKHNLKIYVVETGGVMSDHYDGARKVIRLSADVFRNNTIASVSIAAHEAAHAIQDKEGYLPLKLRGFIAPVAKFASSMSYVVILIGIFANLLNLLYLGIFLLGLVLVFQLVTLPVELNASKRALEELSSLHIVNKEEKTNSKKMLQAAAFTYIASVITSILEIVRLMLIARD